MRATVRPRIPATVRPVATRPGSSVFLLHLLFMESFSLPGPRLVLVGHPLCPPGQLHGRVAVPRHEAGRHLELGKVLRPVRVCHNPRHARLQGLHCPNRIQRGSLWQVLSHVRGNAARWLLLLSRRIRGVTTLCPSSPTHHAWGIHRKRERRFVPCNALKGASSRQAAPIQPSPGTSPR